MSTDDDSFNALGPSPAGFFCDSSNLLVGGYMTGLWYGLWGQGLNRGPQSFVQQLPPFGVAGSEQDGPGVIGASYESSGVYGQNGDLEEPLGGVPAGVCGASELAMGVFGSSSGNRGVFGASETSLGVHGASNASTGVLGWSAQPGPQFGGWPGTPGGVVGTSQNNPGVIGTSTQSFGVAGQSGAPGPTSLSAGVFGTSAASFGVAGTSQTFPGVFGTSTSSFGMLAISGSAGPIFGLPFPLPAAVLATSSKNPGVIGTSNASHGVAGLSTALPTPGTTPAQVPAGVHGASTNGAFGVLGVTTSTPTSPGAGVTGLCNGNGFGVFGSNTNPAGYAGYFQGNLYVTGQIFAGVKDAIVSFPDGSKRLLHCMESPEHWFEDFGSARLKRGSATVKLDAGFAKVVMLDGYRVFLTPEGDCNGLYVRSKRGASFEVRELQGGTSSIAFSYRIVGKRKDIKRHTRFAKIDTPAIAMPVGMPRAGRKPPRPPAAVRALLATFENEAHKKR